MRKPIRKPVVASQGEAEAVRLNIAEFEAKWPNIASHLLDAHYEDGGRRTTSTLLFFAEGPILKLCINDRDVGRVAFLSISSITEGLDALEEGLLQDSLDWRRKRLP